MARSGMAAREHWWSTVLARARSGVADLVRLGEAEEAIPRQLIGRLAAVLFLASGSVALVGLLLPMGPLTNRAWVAEAGALAVCGGAVVWCLPWHRWPPTASLWLVPVAFALIAWRNIADPDPYRYGVFFIITFLWVGVAHPPYTSLRVLPLFLAAYFGPMLVPSEQSASALASVVYVTAI
jgi:hypothetical protein